MIEALERDLPPATLLLGPDLVALLYDAQWAAVRLGVFRSDMILRRHLSAADARGIVKFAWTASFGSFKVVIAALDGSTSQAQNILLKVLEEPPLLPSGEPAIRFILAATVRPLPTIVSRCEVVIVPVAGSGPETDAEIAGDVTVVLKAAQAGDLAALDVGLKGWGDAQHAVLSLLLAEAAAGRGVPSLTPAQARQLLGTLGRFSGAHPRLAAHAALTSLVLNDREQHA